LGDDENAVLKQEMQEEDYKDPYDEQWYDVDPQY
jgi:hypothetical protein